MNGRAEQERLWRFDLEYDFGQFCATIEIIDKEELAKMAKAIRKIGFTERRERNVS